MRRIQRSEAVKREKKASGRWVRVSWGKGGCVLCEGAGSRHKRQSDLVQAKEMLDRA